MKALIVARKTLLELLREPLLLALVVLMPPAFLIINALGYGAPLLVTHPVLVISSDPRGASLIEALQAQRYADGRPVFDITLTTDQAAAETALKERTATALVVISPGASGPLRVTLRGDAVSMNFIRASTILNNVIKRHADRLAGQAEIVQVVEQALFAAGPQSWFDLYTPGMVVFGILMIIPQTAMLVAQEVRRHTLRRLRISRMGSWDLLAGVSLAQMAVAVVQVVLIVGGALALGFHNRGSLWLAIVVGLVLSFSAIGLGLIVACFVSDDSQAVNIGSTVTMLQVFLSGSFFAMPSLTLFSLGGHPIGLFDVFPATHGMLALQQVLCQGAGLREIAFRLGAALVLSVLYFWAGVLVFQRFQLQDRP